MRRASPDTAWWGASPVLLVSRSFVVVASEVKVLAGSMAKAATEIDHRVATIGRCIEEMAEAIGSISAELIDTSSIRDAASVFEQGQAAEWRGLPKL